MTKTPSQSSLHSEHLVWSQVHGRWQLVHGGMLQKGFSLEFHDFSVRRPLNWAESFHEQSLEICLNLHGSAALGQGDSALELGDNEVALFTVPKTKPRAVREPVGRHCFYTMEFSLAWLRHNVGGQKERLKPEIVHFLERPLRAKALLERLPMPPALLPLRVDLLAPPVSKAAADAWYYAKIFEVLALTIFRPDDVVEASDLRNRGRVEKARLLLDRDYETPPSLEGLAKEAGCSAFHLSRIFKKELGVSIPYYLRARRMDKAAEHLRKGQTVTETAIAVGYNNISAFIKAFGDFHCTTPHRWAAMWKREEPVARTHRPLGRAAPVRGGGHLPSKVSERCSREATSR